MKKVIYIVAFLGIATATYLIEFRKYAAACTCRRPELEKLTLVFKEITVDGKIQSAEEYQKYNLEIADRGDHLYVIGPDEYRESYAK